MNMKKAGTKVLEVSFIATSTDSLGSRFSAAVDTMCVVALQDIRIHQAYCVINEKPKKSNFNSFQSLNCFNFPSFFSLQIKNRIADIERVQRITWMETMEE